MEWIKVSIFTTSEGIEPVTGRLYRLGLTGVQIEDKADFLDFLESNKPHWDYVDEELLTSMPTETCVNAYVSADAYGNELLIAIKDSLTALRQLDSERRFGKLSMKMMNLNEEDWAENWKKYYKPFRIGNNMVVVPSWESFSARNTDVVLKLDPGMAFGTGTHESTKLCLTAAESALSGIQKSALSGIKVLDIGCGSGILSIATLLLGAGAATAIDIDPLAADIARQNALLNGFSLPQYSVFSGNILDDVNLQKQIGQFEYDLIFANIVADVILALTPLFPLFLKNSSSLGGMLIASGIIAERKDEVANALTANGLAVKAVYEDNGWACLSCQLK